MCVIFYEQALRENAMDKKGEEGVYTVGASKNSMGAMQKIMTFVDNNILRFDANDVFFREPLSFFPSENDSLHNMFDIAESECPSLLRSYSHFSQKMKDVFLARTDARGVSCGCVDDEDNKREDPGGKLDQLQAEPLVGGAHHGGELQGDGDGDEAEGEFGED